MASISYAHSLLKQWSIAVETYPLLNGRAPSF